MSAPQIGPPQPWPQHNSSHTRPRHNSAPFSSTNINSTAPLDGNGDPLPPELTSSGEEAEDGESEYLRECYFARHPEDINPDLSLGWIEHHAPLPTKRPLPATFAEAEVEALAPRRSHPTDDESISDYFINAKRHEALLSIRQTDAWVQVKDDLVFREFSAVPPEVLSMSEILERYKDRPDPNWVVQEASPTPEPEELPTQAQPTNDTNGHAMDIDRRRSSNDRYRIDNRDEQDDVLGNLEQALEQNGAAQTRRSRADSTASALSQSLSRPRALRPIRDQAQEDILASLGVTGSPKMLYQTLGPAFGAPPIGQASRHNSLNSNQGGWQVPPPPPPPPVRRQRSDPFDPWSADGQPHRNGYHTERRGSNTSQHTATGSDFDPDDRHSSSRPTTYRANSRMSGQNDSENGTAGSRRKQNRSDSESTPLPKFHRTESGKGGHEETEDSELEDRIKQEDEETPKQRRKQQRINDAYR